MEYRSVPLEVLRDLLTYSAYGAYSKYSANKYSDLSGEQQVVVDRSIEVVYKPCTCHDSQPVELKSQGYSIIVNTDSYEGHVLQSPHVNYGVGEYLVHDEVKYLITEVNHIFENKEYVIVIQCVEDARRYERG
jgi:hypothetical protein